MKGQIFSLTVSLNFSLSIYASFNTSYCCQAQFQMANEASAELWLALLSLGGHPTHPPTRARLKMAFLTSFLHTWRHPFGTVLAWFGMAYYGVFGLVNKWDSYCFQASFSWQLSLAQLSPSLFLGYHRRSNTGGKIWAKIKVLVLWFRSAPPTFWIFLEKLRVNFLFVCLLKCLPGTLRLPSSTDSCYTNRGIYSQEVTDSPYLTLWAQSSFTSDTWAVSPPPPPPTSCPSSPPCLV